MLAIDLHHWIAERCPPHTPEDEVDGIMAGDPETEVSGIAVTWLPNLDVLQRAARQGLNFIIAHEPVFYHHPYYYPYGDDHHVPALDLAQKMATGPGTAKVALIENHNLVVYRLHDGWDQFPTYGMGYALARTLGWSAQQVADEYIFELEEQRLADLAAMVTTKLGKQGVRYVGDPDRQVRKVSLDWGSPGAIDIVNRALKHGCDVALTGEVIEWRDLEYARDAGLAMITGGHCATETPGMMACHEWLSAQDLDVPIAYLDSVDPDQFA